MYKKRQNGPLPLLKGGGRRKRRQVCLLLQKHSKRQRRTKQQNAVNMELIPKRTLTEIALSIHRWEIEQRWFKRNDRHPVLDHPTFNPVNYIQTAAQRAQIHGHTFIPVIAQSVPTRNSEFFEFIMGLLNIKVQLVSV